MSAVHAIAIAVMAAACGTPSPTPDELAERYVRVTLQLAQHDPSLVEAWTGPESLKPGPRVPVAGLAAEVDSLAKLIAERGDDVASSEESSRLRYLTGQVRALGFSADRLLGRTTGIDAQLREEFGIEAAPFDPVAAERVRADIDRAVPGAGPLSDRLARSSVKLSRLTASASLISLRACTH